MKTRSGLAVWSLAILCLLGSAREVFADPGDVGLEALLVWGTNDPRSPDPNHKPVPPAVAGKLKKQFKWTHYFEVNRKQFTASSRKASRVSMSRECEIRVRVLKGDKVELQLYGRGELVGKVTQGLPRNELLVMGGNAENLTAWFVVLSRTD